MVLHLHYLQGTPNVLTIVLKVLYHYIQKKSFYIFIFYQKLIEKNKKMYTKVFRI